MNRNDKQRQKWVKKTIAALPKGRILDAGAGELRNKEYCSHLEYVSQDLCQYDGRGDDRGLQNQVWDTSKIDIISDITAIPVDDGAFEYVLCTEVFEHIKDCMRLKRFGHPEARWHTYSDCLFCSPYGSRAYFQRF